jgi:hypothetical protein
MQTALSAFAQCDSSDDVLGAMFTTADNMNREQNELANISIFQYIKEENP